MFLIGLDAHQVQFFFEFSSPNGDATLSIIEDYGVCQSPYCPASSDNYFSEDLASKLIPSIHHHIQWRQVKIPAANWDGAPACLTKGAFKEKVKTSFFTTCVA